MSEVNATLEIDADYSHGRDGRDQPEKDYEVVEHGNDRADASRDGNKDSAKVKSNQKADKKEPCLTILDTSDRDPNRIAENVKVTFEDIIAEPDDTLYSFDQVWEVSKLVFRETKLWVYRVITLLFGILLAIIWGLVFACISFAASWCCVPCMKVYRVSVGCCKPYYIITLDCFLQPLIAVVSKLFYNIRVFHVGKDPEA